ncbi:MAG: hypothetical protein ACI9BW_004410 [Gammaproteobacteria bacterium]|jgi:hypothetical protein
MVAKTISQSAVPGEARYSAMESYLSAMLDRKCARKGKGRYMPRNAIGVAQRLTCLFQANGGSRIARDVTGFKLLSSPQSGPPTEASRQSQTHTDDYQAQGVNRERGPIRFTAGTSPI